LDDTSKKGGVVRGILAIFLLVLTALQAGAQCGGSWPAWTDGVRQEALAKGIDARAVEAVLGAARQNASVLKADRSQAVFRQDFLKFSGRAVSKDRLQRGAVMRKTYASVFDRVTSQTGIPPEVILAFWAMETDYGAVMGNIPTIEALATLAHDCRRPELFRPQLIAAMALVERGDFSVNETGAWAGEIGHVQMLPGDILERGVDGDGDGSVTIKTSAADAILSAAKMLQHHGWRRGEPWLVEVKAPLSLDWSLAGFDRARPVSEWASLGVIAREGSLPKGSLKAILLAPQGRKGPLFLGFENFTQTYLEWNKSLVNTTTAAYLATRLGGAAPYDKGNPDPPFSAEAMVDLQKRLKARGHDVGKVDGILGRLTRAAVRAEQTRLGLPADGWPTRALYEGVR
jgi:lytic murein transglycosylase